MGHIKAAEAICVGIKKLDIQSNIYLLNPLSNTNPYFAWFINAIYLWMAEYIPILWGWIYDNKILSSPKSPLRCWGRKRYAKSIIKDIEEFKPDVIVSTHPFTTEGVSELKRRRIIDIPLISIATDYDVHPFGISEFVDIFIVPCHQLSYQLEAIGIKSEKIRVCGIPIDPKFGESKGKGFQRKVLDLREDLPVALILSGGFGLNSIENVVRSFAGINYHIQLIVVTGTNKRLKKRLERIIKKIPIPIKLYGFITNMEVLMEASDVIITKPGGISISEAVAKGLPLILIKPIKGQEIKNVDYLLGEGIALYLKNSSDVPKTIISLLSNPERLSVMHERSLRLSNPKVAMDIAKIILDIIIKPCQA